MLRAAKMFLARPSGASRGRRLYTRRPRLSLRETRPGFANVVEFYVALILALTLAAVAGLLYFYIMFLEARGRQQRRRIEELERANDELLEELSSARGREGEDGRELWPEVIDEDSDYSGELRS